MRGELVVEPIPPVRLERVLAEAERSRPDLAESQAALLESQRRYAQARAEARPDIILGPRVQNALGETGDRVGARCPSICPCSTGIKGGLPRAPQWSALGLPCSRPRKSTRSATWQRPILELQAAQTRLDYHRTHVQSIVEQTEAAIRGADADKVFAPDQVSELMEQLSRMRVEQLELRYLHTRLRTRLEILLGCSLEDLQEAG